MNLLRHRPLQKEIAEIADLLDTTGWVGDFGWSLVEELATYLRVYEIGQGVEIIEEGRGKPFLGLIVSGKLHVNKSDAAGHQQRISELGAGKAIGEISLVDGHPPSASVMTAENTVLLVLSKTDFDQLCEEKPHIGVLLLRKICSAVCLRLRSTSGKLVDFLDDKRSGTELVETKPPRE